MKTTHAIFDIDRIGKPAFADAAMFKAVESTRMLLPKKASFDFDAGLCVGATIEYPATTDLSILRSGLDNYLKTHGSEPAYHGDGMSVWKIIPKRLAVLLSRDDDCYSVFYVRMLDPDKAVDVFTDAWGELGQHAEAAMRGMQGLPVDDNAGAAGKSCCESRDDTPTTGAEDR